MVRPQPIKRRGDREVEFDPTAAEVSILDRSGRSIWRKSKGETLGPIRWEGMDQAGKVVETGDYVCKITYPNDQITYLPFVFVTKP